MRGSLPRNGGNGSSHYGMTDGLSRDTGSVAVFPRSKHCICFIYS